MKSQSLSYPKTVLAFVLVPVLFNLLMWQNYPVSAECLMNEALLGMGMSNALLLFGLGFGLFTSVFAGICFSSFFSLNTVLKKLRINNYVRRHRSLYAALWILSFTLGSFGGFLIIVCVSNDAHISNVYLRGLQGFLIAGLAAGCAGMVIATFWASLLDQAKRHMAAKER